MWGEVVPQPIYTHNRLTLDCPNPKVRITWGMTMFVVPRDRPHSRPEFRPHRREGGEQHVRESRSEPDSLGGVSLLVHGAAPESPGFELGLKTLAKGSG